MLEEKAKCKEAPLRCQLLFLPRKKGNKKPASTFHLCEKQHRKENSETGGPVASWRREGRNRIGRRVGGDQVGAMGAPTPVWLL